MSTPIRSDYLAFGRPDFTEEEIDAVARVMRSGWVGMGPETQSFENELAAAVGAAHVVTVDSCTSALTMSLHALGVGPGDEVICPSLTWCSTANAALYRGASVVFCEIDADTFCLTPESVMAKVTPRTRAVMVVHFGGYAIDVGELRRRLPAQVAIIEDAAHAMGARYPDGRPVGSSENLVCYSFYANKNISTAEGGAVATKDAALADRIRSLRQHALPMDAWKRFTHAQVVMLSPQLSELGYKANYTDLHAAIGRVQLRRTPEMAARRRALSRRYLQRLAPLHSVVRPQASLDSTAHAQHLFPVRIGREAPLGRDELLLECRRRNIGATIHYALLHLMPLYCAGKPCSLPGTETLGREILTLPMSAHMTDADVDYVCDHLSEIFS